jgi:hypothetical protein
LKNFDECSTFCWDLFVVGDGNEHGGRLKGTEGLEERIDDRE